MLKIRPQQADSLAASAFVDRTVDHVRRFHPRAVADAPGTRGGE